MDTIKTLNMFLLRDSQIVDGKRISVIPEDIGEVRPRAFQAACGTADKVIVPYRNHRLILEPESLIGRLSQGGEVPIAKVIEFQNDIVSSRRDYYDAYLNSLSDQYNAIILVGSQDGTTSVFGKSSAPLPTIVVRDECSKINMEEHLLDYGFKEFTVYTKEEWEELNREAE